MKDDEIKRRKDGYKRAMQDIKEMGIEWAKHKFAIQLKRTGIDPCFTVGYGEALVYASMRNPT